MTTPNNIEVDPATTLADVNKIVAQTEGVIGPLIGIGNDGTNTTLTFDSDPPAPAKNAVIAPHAQGAPTAPAGSKFICNGTIFVVGALTPCSATRPV